MFDSRIVRIEWTALPGRRPRVAGMNSRISVHGQDIAVLMMRLETDDGQAGVGWSDCSRENAGALLGQVPSGCICGGQGTRSHLEGFRVSALGSGGPHIRQGGSCPPGGLAR